MNSPRIVRGTPDVAYISCRNLTSAAVGDGECVIWMASSDTPPTGYTYIPGVDLKESAAASKRGAGITKTPGTTVTVAQGDYVMVQVSGYHGNVKTTAAALAVDVVVQVGAANAVVVADEAAATDISKKRLGVCIKTGAANRAGVMIEALGR